MSFATWKKRSKQWNDLLKVEKITFETVCQAAYKAGERQGRKDAEEAAKMTIELVKLMEKI